MACCPAAAFAAGFAASATSCQWLKKMDSFSKLMCQKHSHVQHYVLLALVAKAGASALLSHRKVKVHATCTDMYIQASLPINCN